MSSFKQKVWESDDNDELMLLMTSLSLFNELIASRKNYRRVRRMSDVEFRRNLMEDELDGDFEEISTEIHVSKSVNSMMRSRCRRFCTTNTCAESRYG